MWDLPDIVQASDVDPRTTRGSNLQEQRLQEGCGINDAAVVRSQLKAGSRFSPGGIDHKGGGKSRLLNDATRGNDAQTPSSPAPTGSGRLSPGALRSSLAHRWQPREDTLAKSRTASNHGNSSIQLTGAAHREQHGTTARTAPRQPKGLYTGPPRSTVRHQDLR
jgi:hypothetical protein